MNYKQKIILVTGSMAALLILLFLPVQQVGYGEESDGSDFYIFVSHLFSGWAYFDTAIDFGRLIIELIVVTGSTLVSFIIFRNYGHNSSSRKAAHEATVSETEHPSA